MVNDGIFEIDGITVANIAKLADKQSLLEEQRICEIADAVYSAASFAANMLADGYGMYEILSIISDGFSSADSGIHQGALPENEKALFSYLKVLNANDKILFSTMFFDKLTEMGISIRESSFLEAYTKDETFTYVKNPLADEAFDVFSQDFRDPRVKYSKSLNEAAKAVSSGEVEYALLPLEEKGGARLSAVAAIMFREDLKINSVTPVFGYEGLADMKYALVAKHFSLPELLFDDDRYLEIRLRADSSVPLSELFLAADILGATLYRVNTISFDTEDGPVPYYSIVFRDDCKDFSSLLVYLTLFSGAYTPVGIYKNLE